MNQVAGSDIKIILVDFNAKVGKDQDSEPNTSHFN
jgi:hypothetical protein